jgi:hypothetical protein
MFGVGHGAAGCAAEQRVEVSEFQTFRPASAAQSPALAHKQTPHGHLGQVRFAPQERSLLNACEDNLDWSSLQLWPKGSLAIVGVKSEGASRINRVRAEDALTLFACNKADLATFDFHEANNCSAHAGRSNRARRSFGPSRSLIALLTLGVLPASGERQHQKNDEPANLHDESCVTAR